MKPLAIIFLTIFVNLVGFGIIIPLLPFYAQTFGASPLIIGLLFASFSLSQLLAAPLLGDLSDRWGRRPVLIFSLLGTVVSFVMLALAQSLAMLFAARIVDGLSGGNITTARAYIADITTEENRAKAFGVLGAAFGLGFIVGPALGAAFSHISYTAPIWAAAAITVVATALAYFWLPETVHRAHAGGRSPWHALADVWSRTHLRVLFTIDFVYWAAFAVYQTTFALFGERRFGFDAAHTGYLLERVRLPGRRCPGRPRRAGRLDARGESDAGGRAPVRRGRLGRERDDALHPDVRRHARAGGDWHRLVQRDAQLADQQGRVTSRTRPGAGRGRRARESRTDDWPGLGQRHAAEIRRRYGLRVCRRRADRDLRPGDDLSPPDYGEG